MSRQVPTWHRYHLSHLRKYKIRFSIAALSLAYVVEEWSCVELDTRVSPSLAAVLKKQRRHCNNSVTPHNCTVVIQFSRSVHRRSLQLVCFCICPSLLLLCWCSLLGTCGWQRMLSTAGNKGNNGVVLSGFLELYFSLYWTLFSPAGSSKCWPFPVFRLIFTDPEELFKVPLGK